MGPAHGTKQRHIERCKYNPTSVNKAHRRIRTTTERGSTQTFKKVGDKIITDRVTHTVTSEGFQ